MKHDYMIFGYRVRSAFALDAYHCEFDEPEIIVESGRISCNTEDLEVDGFYFSMDEDLIAFYVPDVGTYEIRNGNRITVEPDYDARLQDLSLFILGSAFGFLMHQKKVYPLHGSTVDLGNHCITLVGHSGAGKSSLASGFVEKGYKLLSDDVSRIESIDTNHYVYPSYPSQKIWKDGAHHLSLQYEPENRVMRQLDKFYINSRERFSDRKKPLAGIIEIVPSEVHTPVLIQLERPAVLNALISHSYLQEVIGGKTDVGAHLRFCSKLCESVPVYRIMRPYEGFTVIDQVETIMEIFEKRTKEVSSDVSKQSGVC